MNVREFTNLVAITADTNNQPIGVDVVSRVLRCVGDELLLMDQKEMLETVASLVGKAKERQDANRALDVQGE